jgi:hypothetical protein
MMCRRNGENGFRVRACAANAIHPAMMCRPRSIACASCRRTASAPQSPLTERAVAASPGQRPSICVFRKLDLISAGTPSGVWTYGATRLCKLAVFFCKRGFLAKSLPLRRPLRTDIRLPLSMFIFVCKDQFLGVSASRGNGVQQRSCDCHASGFSRPRLGHRAFISRRLQKC